MWLFKRFPLPSLLLLPMLFDLTTARHSYRHRLHHHHHHRRPADRLEHLAAAGPSPSVGGAVEAAGAAVIADTINVENGLHELLSDVAKFFKAIDGRVRALEDLVANKLPEPMPGPAIVSIPQFTGSATGNEPMSPTTTTLQPTETAYIAVSHPAALSGSPNTTAAFSRPQYIPPPGSAALFSFSIIPWSEPSTNTTATFTVPFVSADPRSGVTLGIPATTYPAPPVPPPDASYIFNASAKDNVAVYYGQTPDTQPGGLLTLCHSSSVDIVILAFVYDFFTQQGYPTAEFGPACGISNSAQAATAPGLTNCTALGPEISGCQQMGKKVLVSLGGAVGNSTFTSDTQAEQFAGTIWNVFGAGNGTNADLRPFGAVVVDGFDVDNESHNPDYYTTFATALRQLFATDTSKTYYLSASPQCPVPDASTPAALMAQADFVWVQFYNNPACNFNSPGFESSFAAWSANLSASSTTPGKPRLYIGLPAFVGGGSGYVDGSELSGNVSIVRGLYTDNLGGIMLWDGSEGLANTDEYGTDYISYAKAALQY